VITAWREGVNARPPPPPPPRRIARRSPKTRAENRWLGLRTRPHSPRALTPPPRQISKKTQKYDRNIEADLSLVFSYTRVRQCSPIGYMIGYIINIWNIINIGFFLPHEDVCIADL
jgi:hypothetical protein